MSFLLFATTGYLLWVYTAQIEVDHMLKPVFGLSAVGVAAWVHGRWNVPSRTKRTRLIALILSLAFTAYGVYLLKPPALPDPEQQELSLEWRNWTPATQEQLLKEGTPVYIDFTAKWCVTCQVNKGRAYNKDVIKAMQAKGVVALKADKTRSNPAIDEAIRQYGRVAIPVNVLLIPGKQPIILPELLAPNDVLEALEAVESP
jgi:thiol:disulfide interchange protein DsbD